VWVDRGGGLRAVALPLDGADGVRRLAQRLAAMAGRRLDDACPYVDAQLPDGTRLHAVLDPVARGGPYLSLRTFRRQAFSLDNLITAGAVDAAVAQLLGVIVAARLPYLVTGGTGAGKTTILNSLLSLVPPDERIVIVEDAAELRPDHPHVVTLQARASNVEGVGEIPLRALVRQAMRMRPDRLVVDLLGALNTGHEGGAATLHANAPADVPARLEALGLLGDVPRDALHAQVAAAFRVVIGVRRLPPGRVITEVCVLSTDEQHRVVTVPAWRYGHGVGPGSSKLADLLTAAGAPVPALLTGPTADAGSGLVRASG
jgi:pilus assembly protein CpaF